MATTTNGSTSSSTTTVADEANDIATTAKGIASDVADKAVSRAQRLPEAASATGIHLEKANQMIRSESDEVLAVGTSLSLGMAIGLLLGGANRLLGDLLSFRRPRWVDPVRPPQRDATASRPLIAAAPSAKPDNKNAGRFCRPASRCPIAQPPRGGRLVVVPDMRNARRRGLRAVGGCG